MLELLARRIQRSEPGFSAKYVRWAIELSSQAGFAGISELGNAGQKGNRGLRFPACPDLTQSELVSGPSPRCHFLIETASVVAMYKVDKSDSKTMAKHQYFIHLLEMAGATIPKLQIIASLLKDASVLERIRDEMAARNVKTTDKVTFRLDGEFPVEKDYWHGWWRNYRQTLTANRPDEKRAARFRCFATGGLVTPARTHPKIKGLAGVGGLTSGDVLVGFDKEAFCSYGLEQSFNAAVSEEAAKAYSDSLNELVQSTGANLAGAKVVHWFKDKVDQKDDPLYFLTEESQTEELNAREKARRLLQSLEAGQRPELTGNRYYILTLSGAAGRVMVRDWLEGDFCELVRNINQWFDDLELVAEDGRGFSRPPKFDSILRSLAPDLHELPLHVASTMLRVAVRGEPIPFQALSQNLHRRNVEILQDRKLDTNGIAVIRAYHLRKYRKEGNKLAEMLTPKLNKDFPNVAYQCGRLMAALAQLQYAALGDVGAGIVQRYYAAASSTPALVLGQLTKNSQHHLSKLESTQPGLARWYERRITEIWSRLTEPIPKTLTLEAQSLFALGYYHELAELRTGKPENKAEEKED